MTLLPLAKKYEFNEMVVEITSRISYYYTLITLQKADALFIPGSDDPKYTASKIYPYLLTNKPLLTIFNKDSSAVKVINECTENVMNLTFDDDTSNLINALYKVFTDWCNGLFKPIILSENFENYNSENLTGKQTELFIKAIKHFET